MPIFFAVIALCCERPQNDVQNLEDRKDSNSKYLSIYSGGYTVEVVGYSTEDDVEAYALHENGKAKWMFIVNDGFGNAKVMSEKTGTWMAEEDKIIISIEGNTGMIREEFIIKNERFVSIMSNDRYLQKNK